MRGYNLFGFLQLPQVGDTTLRRPVTHWHGLVASLPQWFDSTYDARAASNADFMVYKISGAFFFGATSTVSAALAEIGKYPGTFVFDFTDVPLIDTTAAKALESFVHELRRAGTRIHIAGARSGVRRTLLASGLHDPEVLYTSTVDDARALAQPFLSVEAAS